MKAGLSPRKCEQIGVPIWNGAAGSATAAPARVNPHSLIVLLLVLCAALLQVHPAHANSKYASIVVGGADGHVLYSRNADSRRYPASLTKMMTLYLLFEELNSGRISLTTQLPVSSTAAGRPPSKLGVKPGDTIDVETAIEALAVKSANDVATVVAEKLGGTEWQFANKMNAKAKELGMTRTHFRNASGLPNADQYTTARDMATLGRHIYYDFPQYYHYFALPSFTWKGRVYTTHNHMLKSYSGTDGIKTGYIRASGFNIVTSTRRNGYHLIAVVMGGQTKYSRDDHMALLLNQQFARLSQNPNLVASLVPKPQVKPGYDNQIPIETVVAALKEPQDNSTSAPVDSASDDTTDPEAIPEKKPLYASSQDVVLPASMTPQSSDEVRVASLETSGSGGDPIGDLIAQSQSRLAALGTPSLVNINALGDGGRVDPSNPLSPRIVHSTLSGNTQNGEADNSFGVQVGAYRYEEVAVQRLSAIFSKAPDVLDKAVLAIFPAEVGGKTLYRARIGPYSRAGAKHICDALTNRGVTCYPDFAEHWQLSANTLAN